MPSLKSYVSVFCFFLLGAFVYLSSVYYGCPHLEKQSLHPSLTNHAEHQKFQLLKEALRRTDGGSFERAPNAMLGVPEGEVQNTCAVDIRDPTEQVVYVIETCGMVNITLSKRSGRWNTELLDVTIARLLSEAKRRTDKALKYRAVQEKTVLGFLSKSSPRNFITHGQPQGGLGNYLFELASVLGVAKRNNRMMYLLQNDSRLAYFSGFWVPVLPHLSNFTGIGEPACCMYNSQTANLSIGYKNKAVALFGYLQSWKYFDPFRYDVELTFTFTSSVYVQGIKALEDGLRHIFQSNDVLSSAFPRTVNTFPVLVGVHVRRGDILHAGNKNHGHIPASNEYLLRAVLWFQEKYEYLVFVVISNDLQYCRSLFGDRVNFIYVSVSEAVDMAIMTLMDGMIMSVGTYGFWSAYLGNLGRDIVYYKDWPMNGSDFSRLIKSADYFPSAWKAAA